MRHLPLLLVLPALTVGLAGPATAAQRTVVLGESFEGYRVERGWRDRSVHGNWLLAYNGYGDAGIETDGNKVLFLRPKTSTTPGETHAGLAVTRASYGDFDMTLRIKTEKRLRTPRANAWETAWVVWHYVDDEHFYYLALKPNGWEIGKALPGNRQRYLATHKSPTYPIGRWYDIRVREVGGKMTVWANDRRLANVWDRSGPYLSGRMGLYAEDAHARFDNVWVTTA